MIIEEILIKKSKYSDAQIMAILKQSESGVPVADLCREHGISSASLYKWRYKYCGMDASLMVRMKQLDEENKRLKKMYAEKSMQNDFLEDGLEKVRQAIPLRKEMAEWAVQFRSASIALAFRAFSISETCYRYLPKLNDENELIADWLAALTMTMKTQGFGLCFLHLRTVIGFKWNHKRVYGIYRELELNIRIKPRTRLQWEKPEPIAVPKVPNEIWSMDFMADQLANGRTFSTQNVLDDFDRVELAIELDFSLPSDCVV